jgi:hypothetical protein
MKWSISRQCEYVMSWNGEAPDIVSVCYVMKWSNLRRSISLLSWNGRLILCLGPVRFMTKQTDTMSEIWPFHDKTDWYYVWDLTILWQKRLILCLRFNNFMTKQTDTMSEIWPFHDITDWYYVWDWTISWHNRLILCLSLKYFMTKQTDTSVLSWNGEASDIVSVCFVMKWSSLRHSISLFCHEMVKPQT